MLNQKNNNHNSHARFDVCNIFGKIVTVPRLLHHLLFDRVLEPLLQFEVSFLVVFFKLRLIQQRCCFTT